MSKLPKLKNAQESLRDDKDDLSPQVLARQMLIKGESRRVFFSFIAQIKPELGTSTAIEREFSKKYIFCCWKLRRLREMERHLLNRQQVFTEREQIESYTKRRIRSLKRLHMNDELKEVNNQIERLEKQAVKALKQLRNEQHIHKGQNR